MASGSRKVFFGNFIYPKSRERLAYLFDAAVCVDENGKIAAVAENGAEISDIVASLRWSLNDVEVRTCGDDDFFFPGFIGKFILPRTLQ